ncbi:ABC-type branched-subunit amino acid transport system substrate-binding protein [Crossiella equi]|uniref:ABC-type branched-subunit amino acid transport system substrate-binding protein n=1 Tax=Crossiella equi TaxID=130796 RepID=A0ABS5A965_9PSEU|nr:ABC transporter substrate-binding protein [Crossiella equi]MBP2472764.1 ABC-type branched-subunit amino acid transport system substrate-binding protein [Crossiella equi]
MALEPDLGLVGRDGTAALLASLLDRKARRPLPVVVAYGPGGSGKTTLLDHLERRCRPAVPVARVDLDETGSKSCRDVLDAVFGQLRRYSNVHFGRMRLPRYELLRLVQSTVAAPDDEDPHRRARALLARRLTGLPRIADVVGAVAETAPAPSWLTRLVQPFLRWLITLAVVAPPRIRWLLAPSRFSATWRWYERVAGESLLEMPKGVKVDAVVAQIWHLVDADRQAMDRLLVAAFLADLEGAYKGVRRRRRRVNCVLLLDGADLLSPYEVNLFPPGHLAPEPPASDLLELLADARLRGPDTPLLVVATKQSTPGEDPFPPEHADLAPADAAHARYHAWKQRFEQAREAGGPGSAAVLPVRLRPFTLEQTRQFLHEWNLCREGTVQSEALVAELHEVTKGHPLAVRLATQVVDRLFRRDRVIPAVRSVFTQRVPREESGAEPDEKVGDYLLVRFLQRFRGSDVPERAQTRRLLTRLAAPRRLDLATIQRLVPDRDAEDLWGRLTTYSFTDRSPGGRWITLHPLLRDLLNAQLLAHGAGAAHSYEQVHRELRNHYTMLGRQEDRLYHALALGDTHVVASHLSSRLTRGDSRWVADLEVIATAPGWRPNRQLRARLNWPRVRKVEELLMAVWKLRSVTSVARRTAELYDDVLRAYRALDASGQPAVAERLARYRTMVHLAEDNSIAEPGPALPRYSSAQDRHPYPMVWPPPHTLRRTAVAATLLLLVGYGGVYVRHQVVHCDRDGVFAVGRVLDSVFDPSLVLAKSGQGECYGVTDGVGNFMHDTEEILPDDVEVAELSRLIAEQNEQVVREAARPATDDRRRPYATVVVASMLSSANEVPRRDLSAGVNELRGAYLAQRAWNRFNTSSIKPPFLLRLVLANFGGNSEFAQQTAERVQALVAADPTVVAVSGMGQTRDSTIRAAEILGAQVGPWQGIPMVASAPTGNAFSGKDYFFRVSPPNQRQAEAAIAFAATDPNLGNRQPFLLHDPTDRYSADLKDNYLKSLLGLRSGLAEPVELTYEAQKSTTANLLASRVQEMCARAARTNRRPLLVYSGRANEMPTLLEKLAESDCRADTAVLGADDLSQLETAGYSDLMGNEQQRPRRVSYVDGRLYFTTLGPTEEGWRRITGGHPPAEAEQFFSQHTDAQNEQPEPRRAFRSGPNGHVMLAYDAVNLLLNAVDRARTDTTLPDRAKLYAALRATTGPNTFRGVTGTVDFGTIDPELLRRGADPRNKQVVVQQVVADGDHLRSTFLRAIT